MDEMMIDPRIELPVAEPEQISESEQIRDLESQSQAKTALFRRVQKTIDDSQTNRHTRHIFEGGGLSEHLENLRNMEDSDEFLSLVVEMLQCDSRAIPGIEDKQPTLIIYNYAYESIDDWESSESYNLFLNLQERAAKIDDEGKREALLKKLNSFEKLIIDTFREYYEALENSSETDVVIVYDKNYRDQANELINNLIENQYSVEAFDITDNTTYRDPELLSAMHNSTLMIRFCESGEEGEKKFRTKQYDYMALEEEGNILFITKGQTSEGKRPFVSFSDTDWISKVNEKVPVLTNGAKPKETFVKELSQREENIQEIIDQSQRSKEEIGILISNIEDQIGGIEDYRALYGNELPCKYDVDDLEEIARRYSNERKDKKTNSDRWLGKMRRDDGVINAILNNKNPKRFYERYIQLCKLIDAQQEHRDKLLATGMTMDELKKKLGDVEIDRLKLHSKRWEYQRAFKETVIKKYMQPFDKEFFKCKAIDSIKPLRIDSHIENFEKFTACGIYLSKEDGLNYWTKHAFTHALNEKRYDQNVIDSQLERITHLSENIEHSVRDYYNPTFRADRLEEKAKLLTKLVEEFEAKWSFKLVNKKQIYGGYKGKMCFAKYVDSNRLDRDVKDAIEKSRSGNIAELLREHRARSVGADEFYNLGETFFKQHFNTQDRIEKEKLLSYANAYFKKAADLGDRKAQYKFAKNYENGRGLIQNMDIALVYYTLSAENNYAEAQLRLAEYYKDNNDMVRALEWYEKAANHKNRPNFDACMFLGYHYDKSDKVDDKKRAIQYFLLAKDNTYGKEIESPRPCYLLGMEYLFNRKNYAEAAKWFEKVTNNPIADVYCGDCYFMLGKYQKAIDKYSNIDKDELPDDRKIALGDYLLEQGNHKDAYEYYSKCKKIDSDPIIKSKIGDCYLVNGDTEGAIKIYMECFDESGDVIIKKKLADVWFSEGKYNGACKCYLEYFAEFYDSVVLERIGDCYLNGDSENKEENAYLAYLKCLDTITDTDKLGWIADMLIKNGENKKAFNLIDKLVVNGSRKSIPEGIIDYVWEYDRWVDLAAWYSEYGCELPDASLLHGVGNHYRLNGDIKAVECYEKYAAEYSVEDTAIINYMIDYYNGIESPEKTAAWIERLGDAYLSQGREAAALRQYKRIGIDNAFDSKKKKMLEALKRGTNQE